MSKIGEIRSSNDGSVMKVIEYNSWNDCVIEFQDCHKHQIRTQYGNFKKGSLKNPYRPSVMGVGFLGSGEYRTKANGKQTKEYSMWSNMINRVYSKSDERYSECIVADEWHNFQNFAKWANENGLCNDFELDKDYKSGKIYSPSTCILIPHKINAVITGTKKGKDLPVGVFKNGEKYKSMICVDGKQIEIGVFDTVNEADISYRKEKSIILIGLAEQYKELISGDAYDAIVKYAKGIFKENNVDVEDAN